MTRQSIWRQQFPLMTLSSFCFSTAKYFCPLFATNAYDKKLNYCSSFQYVFLRESLQKNKRLKVIVGALGLYTALLYYSLQCIFNVRGRKIKCMLISRVRLAVTEGCGEFWGWGWVLHNIIRGLFSSRFEDFCPHRKEACKVLRHHS